MKAVHFGATVLKKEDNKRGKGIDIWHFEGVNVDEIA